MTPWILAIIAALLFYKLVERRHKIVLSKVIGILAAVAAIALLVLYLRQRSLDAAAGRDRAAVHVTLIPFAKPANPFDQLSSLDFQVCNSASRATRTTAFEVAGLYEGRSTEYNINAASTERWRTAAPLSSDRILLPGACDTITAYGTFGVYDEYRIRTISVSFLEPKAQ